MSGVMLFLQGCPACGRRLQIRVEYLGKSVVCQHCGRRFVASDQSSAPASPELSSVDALLRRAEELLKVAAPEVLKNRPAHPL